MAAVPLNQTTLINDADLVLYCQLNGNSTEEAQSLTATESGVSWVTSNPFGSGQCLSLSGSGYVRYTDNSLALDNTYTQAVWFKGAAQYYASIFGWGDTNPGHRRAILMTPDAPGYTGFSGNGVNLFDTTTVGDGNWHLCIVTMGPAYQCKVYVDGSLKQQNTLGLSAMTYSNTFLGNDPLGAGYTGQISESFLFKRVWSTDEVSQYYAGTLPGLNANPNTPTISAPTNGATGQSRTPTLTASAFSDPDAGDTHAGSQWEVYTDSGFSTKVWDSGDTATNLTSCVVNATNGTFSGALAGRTVLGSNTTYYWRVKYKDSKGGWSAYGS